MDRPVNLTLRERPKKIDFFLLCLLIMTLIPAAATAGAAVRSSSNYAETADIIAGSGGATSSANYSNQSAAGQSTAIGISTSASYRNSPGFFHEVTPLDAPAATAATNPGTGGFSANWNAVPGADGYRLDVATDSSFTTTVPGYDDLDVGNEVTRAVSFAVAEGTTYYYRVRTYSGTVTSEDSNIIDVTPRPVVTGTASPSTDGDVSCTSPVDSGSTTSCSVVPNTGHHTVSVTGCGGTWTGTSPYITGAVTGNCTVTATFAINQYSVSASAGTNGSLSGTTPSPATVNYASTASFTFNADAHYHITGVSDTCGSATYSNASNSVTSYTFTTTNITGDCEVTATFEINQYSVSASAGSGGSLSGSTPSPATVDYGSTASFTFNADTGYHIGSISGCGITYSNSSQSVTTHPVTTAAVTADCTVTATFAINHYSVSASAGTNGSLSGTTPSPATVNYASTASFTFNADAHYHITGVSDTCGSATYSNTSNAVTSYTFTTTNITGNCSVSATFGLNQYTLTYNTDGQGILIGATTQTIPYGGSATVVTALADSGYVFINWTGTGGFTTTSANPLSNITNITSDMTITAHFGALYTVTMNVFNGVISCSPTTVAAGGSSSCAFTANAGFYPADVTDNLATVATPASPYDIVNINEDHDITLQCDEYFVQRYVGTTVYAPYLTIQSAVNDISTSLEALEVKAVLLTENVLMDKPGVIFLEGGYNTDFTDNTDGFTTINGSLTISDGTVEISNMIIR
jgi:uncharacterized repeat protein (TIGR02543 family)